MADNKYSLTAAIYNHIFQGIGLIILLVGIFFLGLFLSKQFASDKYYLGYDETRCDYLSYPVEPITAVTDTPVIEVTPGAETEIQELPEDALIPVSEVGELPKSPQEQQKEDCLVKLEEQRRVQRFTDFSTAIVLVVLGAIVFFYHKRRLS